MTYYLAAYVIFWVALFGYLLGLTRRQARLVGRADALIARLARAETRGADPGSGAGGAG